MRPPLNAGENSTAADATFTIGIGFNEAPAERGGKRSGSSTGAPTPPGFNEAPAERGGKRAAQAEHAGVPPASMRPPLNAGENGPRLHDAARGVPRFNEAPAERGGKPP